VIKRQLRQGKRRDQQTEQQRYAAGQHQQGVLAGRLLPARTDTPQGDQEIDRHDREFPAEEKEHRIDGKENAEHRDFSNRIRLKYARLRLGGHCSHQAAKSRVVAGRKSKEMPSTPSRK
jgi:hypothetical protein